MDEQNKSSIQRNGRLLSKLSQVILPIITFGMFLVNYFQYTNNKATLSLLSEQQKYSFVKPRLTISREHSILSESRRSFIIRVKNVGNSPACNIFLAMERPIDTTKHFEFYEQWAFIQRRDTSYSFFEEDVLHPQEIADIKVVIESMFEKDLNGKTEREKGIYFLSKIFDLYIYYEDLEGKGYLTTCRIGPHMKHPLKIMSPEVVDFFRKYKTPKFDWKIRFYEDVDLTDISKKKE